MGDSGEQGEREQELHSRIPFFLTCEFCRAGGGRDHTTRLRTLGCLNAWGNAREISETKNKS
jgi:hypothetical protein